MSWLSTQLKVSPLSSSCIRGKKKNFEVEGTLSTLLYFKSGKSDRHSPPLWRSRPYKMVVWAVYNFVGDNFFFGKMWLVQLPWPQQNCAKLVRPPQEGVPGNRWHATISYSNLWPQYFQGWVSEGQTGSSSTSLASSVAFWDCAG